MKQSLGMRQVRGRRESRTGTLNKDGKEPRVWPSDAMLAWHILSPGFHFCCCERNKRTSEQ